MIRQPPIKNPDHPGRGNDEQACQWCGQPYHPWKSRAASKYCSVRCRSDAVSNELRRLRSRESESSVRAAAMTPGEVTTFIAELEARAEVDDEEDSL